MWTNAYKCFAMFMCLILAVANVSSYAIDQTASSDAAALEVLNEFRTHLIAEGVALPSKELTVDTFDELEVLRLLPMIISYMKLDALSPMELDAFEHIYGSIWELVVEESQRHRGQPRNSILTALLASPEIRQTQSKNVPNPNNDVDRNLISKEFKPSAATSVSQEAPSQRVLHAAAAIVQKYYLRQTKHKSTNKHKTVHARRTQRLRSAAVHTKQLSADSIRVTIELPRYKRSVAKPKQPITEDEEDAEMEAKILAAIKAQIGNPSLEEEEDDEEEDEESVPSPTEDDSSEYLDDEADYMGILGDEDDDDDDDDDDDGDDEEEENYEGRVAKGALFAANGNDFENPSFNELLQLAARHRAIQQQRQQQQQYLAYRKSPSNHHSSYEDY